MANVSSNFESLKHLILPTTPVASQLRDLDTWMGIYLPLDEPLPSTVRQVNVSKFNYFFGQDKTFRLTGVLHLDDDVTKPLKINASLSAYPPNQPAVHLSDFTAKLLPSEGFPVTFNVEDIAGSFTLCIRIVGRARQVWGSIQCRVKGTAHFGDFYLCPVVPVGTSQLP